MRRSGSAVLVACVAALLGCRAQPAPPGGSWCYSGASTRVTKTLGTSRRLTLGLVADSDGAAPEQLATLTKLATTFREQHVDAVVTLGNLGSTQHEIAEVLATLATAGVPILALPGELEPADAFHAAIASARAAGHDVVDLAQSPLVDTGAIDLVAVPGAPQAANGCVYRAEDLTALAKRIGRHWRPLVVLAQVAPRRDQPESVDWEAGQHVGDGAMLELYNAVYPNAMLFARPNSAGGTIERGLVNVGGVRAGTAAIVALVDGLPHATWLR